MRGEERYRGVKVTQLLEGVNSVEKDGCVNTAGTGVIDGPPC